MLPAIAAQCKTLAPSFTFTAFTLAPLSTKYFTVSKEFRKTHQCKGVLPFNCLIKSFMFAIDKKKKIKNRRQKKSSNYYHFYLYEKQHLDHLKLIDELNLDFQKYKLQRYLIDIEKKKKVLNRIF